MNTLSRRESKDSLCCNNPVRWSVARQEPLLGRCAGAFLAIVLLAIPVHALTYAEWMAGYPSITGSAALPSATPMSDGVPNLVKFVVAGLEPTVFAGAANDAMPVMRCQTSVSGSLGAVALAPRTGTLPNVRVHPVLRWKQRPGIEGVRIIPMGTSDLKHWWWGRGSFAVTNDGTYTYARSKSNYRIWKRVFMRLKIEMK